MWAPYFLQILLVNVVQKIMCLGMYNILCTLLCKSFCCTQSHIVPASNMGFWIYKHMRLVLPVYSTVRKQWHRTLFSFLRFYFSFIQLVDILQFFGLRYSFLRTNCTVIAANILTSEPTGFSVGTTGKSCAVVRMWCDTPTLVHAQPHTHCQ